MIGRRLDKITQHMSYFLDPSALQVVQTLAKGLTTSKSRSPHHRGRARTFGAVACSAASRRLNTIWGVKAKPARVFGISAKPLSLICDGCRHLFSAAVSLQLKPAQGFSRYAQSVLPVDSLWRLTVYPILTLRLVLLFAMIFKFCRTSKSNGATSGIARC